MYDMDHVSGVANICLITQHTTIVRQRIEVPIPRKRKGGGTALGAERVRFVSVQGLDSANIFAPLGIVALPQSNIPSYTPTLRSVCIESHYHCITWLRQSGCL